jgi:Zn-dependent protease
MMRFSAEEKRDLLKAWLVISAAFAFANTGFNLGVQFLIIFAASAITVGAGFLLHELAHKHVAQRYGCWAEFRSFDQMLMLALVFSFFGFIFAAPGAVMISGRVTPGRNGRISAAGPLVNIVLAAVFGLLVVVPIPLVQFLGQYGASINAWLGLFNLIPIMGLDGSKVLAWNKAAYAALVAAAAGLVFLSPWRYLA